jgi:hypothetical protein
MQHALDRSPGVAVGLGQPVAGPDQHDIEAAMAGVAQQMVEAGAAGTKPSSTAIHSENSMPASAAGSARRIHTPK